MIENIPTPLVSFAGSGVAGFFTSHRKTGSFANSFYGPLKESDRYFQVIIVCIPKLCWADIHILAYLMRVYIYDEDIVLNCGTDYNRLLINRQQYLGIKVKLRFRTQGSYQSLGGAAVV
jgi:hypothetical protein